MNETETRMILKQMIDAWPSFTPSQSASSNWAGWLKDVRFPDAKAAIDLIVNTDTSEFAPNIGKIREAIAKVGNPKTKTVEERFTALMKLAENPGRAGWSKVEPKLSPETLRAVRAITWNRFCDCDVKTEWVVQSLRRDFAAALENVQDSNKVIETVNEQTKLTAPIQKVLDQAMNGRAK